MKLNPEKSYRGFFLKNSKGNKKLNLIGMKKNV